MIRSGLGLVAAAVVFVHRFSGTTLALGLVPSLVRAAPDTWSVNVGGSGDFADLQEAVDHARPGDTILLWGPANGRQLLDSVTIAKGLTIVGLAPERVHLKDIHVRDVPAGARARLNPARNESWTAEESAFRPASRDCSSPRRFQRR